MQATSLILARMAAVPLRRGWMAERKRDVDKTSSERLQRSAYSCTQALDPVYEQIVAKELDLMLQLLENMLQAGT